MSTPAKDLLKSVRVAPSILSADFGRLREQVGEVLDAGARVIHVDVMDGHFVPSITLGPVVVDALSERVHAAGAVLDVHLMIERPERHVAEFVQAGADSITFHAEATPHVSYTAGLLREQGVAAGVAINPATPVGAVAEVAGGNVGSELDAGSGSGSDADADAGADAGSVAGAIDMVLCMTVNPGWGGQAFIAHSLDKIERLRAIAGHDVALEVDGGIDPQTAPGCRKAGANVFVAGSAIFDTPDPGEAYRAIAASVGAG